ncbi:transposable element Tcb1 transposase [Trichonephila clavipes]|uniref:Transposable element Tcb1 transposase n=1 Tax=Trichonephila clavipes TaxID=2585209 RepID=A0A8X6VEM3_TRICX|nr:transposable element Tcb1 transposase [Trichonephila clavipes]
MIQQLPRQLDDDNSFQVNIKNMIPKTMYLSGMVINTGRPQVTTPNEDLYLAVTSKRNRRSTASDLSRQLSSATGTTVSTQIVYRRLGLYADSVAIEVSTRPKLNGIVPGTAFLYALRRRPIGYPDERKPSPEFLPDMMNMIESNID